jgi:hypothetical protein
MHAWTQPLLAIFLAREPVTSLHRVEVHIAGPLAMVEVWRSVQAGSKLDGSRQVASFFDLALPAGAAPLDWELVGRGERIRLAAQPDVQVSAALAVALRLRGLSLATSASDETAHHRVHLVPLSDRENAVLHYRYSAPVACKDGRLILRMPENLEDDPVPAEVTVTLAPLPDGLAIAEASLASQTAVIRPGSRRLVMRGNAPARAAWDIAWRYASGRGTLPGQALAAVARVVPRQTPNGRQRAVPGYAVVGAFCRSDEAPVPRPPAQVVLLVDRSRSVGQGGLSAERALARALVEALPPSVAFNAILFGHEATPLFPLPRMPTREALDVLVDAADPNRLENGTDVVAALERARGLLAMSAAEGAGRNWVVLITDGALPRSQTSDRMQAALAGASEHGASVLILLVRQAGDDEVPEPALAEYTKFARRFGGLLRVVTPGNVADAARALVAAMAKGGDLLDVHVQDAKVANVIEPGQGSTITFTRATRPRRLRFYARVLDGEVVAQSSPSRVKQEWLDPLLNEPVGRRLAWTGATSGMALAILPAAPAAKSAADTTVRGRLDPLVLRNALSLAFMPRARACYLTRRAAKAGDAYLRGRMKLELTLERGELHDAVVRGSTLDNHSIEGCVRDAAWAVEYPRPEHRDAPTTANLNLVFQPRTPEERKEERKPDASPLDRDIELILGPLTIPSDFSDLLKED